jgi:histidinol-phosphate/aromatic aminotransferase/cobyric acid decarboxylase-like protein
LRRLKRKVLMMKPGGCGLPDWVRSSIGTAPDNERCLAALKGVLGI